jgi:hypothetical protein
MYCNVTLLDIARVQCLTAVAYPGILFREGGVVSTNSVEDRGQRERGSGAVAP